MKAYRFNSIILILFFIFSSTLANQNAKAALKDEPLISDEDLIPENYFNVTAIKEMVSKLAGKAVSAYQDDTRDCYKGSGPLRVKTGTGGEERKMDGSITSVAYRKHQSSGNVTVAIFRVFVAGKSWQKGFICVGSEYHKRDEDFRGTAFLKLKSAPGGIAVLKIDVDNDHWGMMKQALKTSLNQAGFIVNDDV